MPGSERGLAIGCGLAVPVGDPAAGGDPYFGAIAAVDECVRNLVCVGADPGRIAILDNFCWPSCEKPENLASLVRAAEGCYDAAKAYRTPFVSGKDSLNNQFRYTDPQTGEQVTIEIPPTLLITGIGIVPDVTKCVTMDLKAVGDAPVVIVSAPFRAGATHERTARAVAAMIRDGLVLAAHDASEGGALVALAEMVLAGGAGAGLRVDQGAIRDPGLFAERSGEYVLQIRPGAAERAAAVASKAGGVEVRGVGVTMGRGSLDWGGGEVGVADLRAAFLGTLDW